ncbi:MAG TPA: hypothetical protein PKH93_01815 [Chitinophagales bacterium]|nr:hypothetical protein [Chitinophagales bacterium]
MNRFKCFLSAIITLAISLQVTAQEVANDSTAQQQLPVQAFAAMPVLLGFSAENALPHEKNYLDTNNKNLNLSMKNSQVYSLYGALPIVKRTKGFGAKINFGYNLFKDNIATTTFNDSVLLHNTPAFGSSTIISLHVSQQILFKKANKKLTLAASYNISGRDIAHFEPATQRGIFTATYPLRMTKNNMLLLGAVGMVGKDIKLPVLPIVIYFTRLNKHLNIELLFPVFGQLRYVVSPRSSLVLGAKIGNRSPFLGLETPILQSPDDALVINSQHLRYFMNIEKALNNYLWLHGEMGYSQSLKENLNTSYLHLPNQSFAGQHNGYMYAKVGVFIRPVLGTIKAKQKK